MKKFIGTNKIKLHRNKLLRLFFLIAPMVILGNFSTIIIFSMIENDILVAWERIFESTNYYYSIIYGAQVAAIVVSLSCIVRVFSIKYERSWAILLLISLIFVDILSGRILKDGFEISMLLWNFVGVACLWGVWCVISGWRSQKLIWSFRLIGNLRIVRYKDVVCLHIFAVIVFVFLFYCIYIYAVPRSKRLSFFAEWQVLRCVTA